MMTLNDVKYLNEKDGKKLQDFINSYLSHKRHKLLARRASLRQQAELETNESADCAERENENA